MSYPFLKTKPSDYINLYCQEIRDFYPEWSQLPEDIYHNKMTALFCKHLGMHNHYSPSLNFNKFKNALYSAAYYIGFELGDADLIHFAQLHLGEYFIHMSDEQSYYLDRLFQLALSQDNLFVIQHLISINYSPYFSKEFKKIGYDPLQHALSRNYPELVLAMIHEHTFIYLSAKNDLATFQQLIQHQFVFPDDERIATYLSDKPNFLTWTQQYIQSQKLSHHLTNSLSITEAPSSQFKI